MVGFRPEGRYRAAPGRGGGAVTSLLPCAAFGGETFVHVGGNTFPMPKITLASLARRLSWLNLPAVLLVALLQRTPLLRVAPTAGDVVIASPLGAVLKAGVASLGALGAFHSMAGATQLVSSTPSPATASVGVPITPIALTVSGTLASPASFTIGGSVPPGLLVRSSGATSGGVTNGVIEGSAVVLSGTPTAAAAHDTLSLCGALRILA
eukprot:gene5314-6621_t